MINPKKRVYTAFGRERMYMKKHDLSSKDYLNPAEAIEFWHLSRRKFYEFLKANSRSSFIAYYGERKLIVREAFTNYLDANPEVKEGLANGTSNKETHQKRCKAQNAS